MKPALKRTEIIRRLRAARVIDVHTHVGIDPVNHAAGNFPYAQSAEDLVLKLDRQAIDMAVAFPFLYTGFFKQTDFAQGRFRSARNPENRFPYERENRLLLEELYGLCPETGSRILPFLFFDPGRRVTEQAEHIRALAKTFPVFGLKTATSYLQTFVSDLVGKGGALAAVARELDLPVLLHTALHPDDPWANAHALLDVAAALPDIRFCLAHSCRFSRSALDRAAALPNAWVDCSALVIHCTLARGNSPAVAPKRDRFPADYRSPADVLARLAESYPETLVWGTDTPYHQFHGSFVDAQGRRTTMHLSCGPTEEITAFRALPKRMQARIGHENALRFLLGPVP